MKTSKMIAIDKILDVKQDVAALLESSPALARFIDGKLSDAVDRLLADSQKDNRLAKLLMEGLFPTTFKCGCVGTCNGHNDQSPAA